jgi:hypothetical protein
VVAVDGAEVAFTLLGESPETVAVFTIEPASRSPWLVTDVAVQEVPFPGASVLARQEIAEIPTKPSENVSPCSVTLPVLVTAKLQVMVWPTAE